MLSLIHICAVVSFMDRGTVYDSELYQKAFEIAEKNGIGCQTKTVVAGGNNASAIHKAAGGIKTLAVSVPCPAHSILCAVWRCVRDGKQPHYILTGW